MYIVA